MSGPEPFGKYQLIERIATGGMAEIYRGRLEAAHGVTKPVVIKKILPHYGQQQSFVRMFINEAKIAVGLSHGNIAQVFDFGEVEGEYYLAMELVDGQPLSRVLRKAKAMELPALPAPFVVQVAIEVCKGLHYAHTRLDEQGRPLNIIHRDVSPQNILVSYEGQVKLVDFGIAKARNASTDGTTQTGAVKGKYVYFAPEQARGKELDARTDIFATGIVLYEALTGRLPFEGKMMEVMKKIVTGNLVRPSQVNPDVPASLERIVLWALATEKKNRPPTSQALQDELSQWLYANAPTYSFSALGHLMCYLFEQELLEDGLPVLIPPGFRARLADWRGPPPETDASLARGGARDPRPSGPGSPSSSPVSRSQERTGQLAEPLGTFMPRSRPLLRWMFWALPLATALLAGLVVFSVGYFGSADVQLTSSPPGAMVVVDGRPAPSVTPVLITGLDPDSPHVLEVQAPGMKVWSQRISLRRGATLTVHAEMEPLGP